MIQVEEYEDARDVSGHRDCSTQPCQVGLASDMEFVQKFTPPDFQAKHFTPSISPNFNSFSKKKHEK